MLPPTMLVPHDNSLPSTPEVRRMDMYHRARQEELDVMINGVYSRNAMTTVGTRRSTQNPSPISRLINAVRKGIGNALVTAGTRLQSQA